MDFNEYQKEARTTAEYPNKGCNPYYPAMGLGGEAGEVLELTKKLMRDCGGVMDDERKEKVKKELGDVLWYIAACASEWCLDLQDIAETNINKLKSRQERDKIQGDGDNR